ncbi:MAG TPA: transglutaminase domain-containing protein [Candidatus Limnocylindrales bacterium]|nr:transglutaminase domain-containing protein [Candidatus Limnocylindrales bacterium]
MTASALPRPIDEPLDRIRLRPAEGWLTLVAVVVLVETFAWSLIDAAWIPSNQGSVGYLSFLAVGGILVELLGAKAGWNRWFTHLVGAVLAGLLLPLIAAAAVLGALGGPVDLTNLELLYRTAGNVAFQVWADLIRDGRPFTSQFGHYHLIFGALVWGAGMAASSAVFNRRRPFDAVVLVGLLLLANMSMTGNDQLVYLVVFSIAALTLLVRAHTYDEQLTWIRRRIGDPSAISGLYLTGGAQFVTAAVFGALVLTTAASSAPLQGMWTDLPSKLSGLSDLIQRLAPAGGHPRPFGAVGFQSSATTGGQWLPASGVAFTAKVEGNVTTVWRWMAGTYATYDGSRRWSWDNTSSEIRPANSPILGDSEDDPSLLAGGGGTKVTVTITPGIFQDPTVLSPEFVASVDRDTTLVLTGDRFTTVQYAGGGPYTITALVPVFSDTAPGGITQAGLRQSPKTYPDDISSIYLQIPQGTLGPNSMVIFKTAQDQATAAANAAGASPDNPFDFAQALQDYLRGSAFTYNTDVRDLVDARCGGMSSVECFATIRTGYCEYYASLMTMLLRQDGIPARIAYGFLPGKRQADGTETVDASNAHWWVEAYFAGYGWIEFDPTGTRGFEPFIPAGGPKETARPIGTTTPRQRNPDRNPDRNGSFLPGGGAGSTAQPPSTSSGPFAVVGGLLLLVVVAVVVTSRRRRPRLPMDPDHAWGGVGKLASRFGLGPRPAQTVYEYAGALADAVPSARIELATIARAKVEVAYGRQSLGPDRLKAVGSAYRRLRFAIVRRGFGRFVRRSR